VNDLDDILIRGSNYAIPEKKWSSLSIQQNCVVCDVSVTHYWDVTSVWQTDTDISEEPLASIFLLWDVGSRTTQNVGTYLPDYMLSQKTVIVIIAAITILSLLGELYTFCFIAALTTHVTLRHQPDSSSLSWWGSHSPSWEIRLLGRECEGLGEAFSWLRRWLSCITWSCSRDLCSSRRNRSRSSSRSFIIFCNGHGTLLVAIKLIITKSYIKNRQKIKLIHRKWKYMSVKFQVI
jgi:hypothetical protein